MGNNTSTVDVTPYQGNYELDAFTKTGDLSGIATVCPTKGILSMQVFHGFSPREQKEAKEALVRQADLITTPHVESRMRNLRALFG